jgi:alpha-amylase
MRSICFYFQVHQPFRLKSYRFFNMGQDHYYYDTYLNQSIAERVAKKSYLPMNQLLLDLLEKHGKDFKVSFSITGLALEQFELYTPEVLDSFKKLADTGKVEFLAETYAHSLVSLKNSDEFVRQVKMHRNKIKELFGVEPVTFRNTELIYSDEIGERVADLGFKTMLTEGAKHILGWKSPNYMYTNPLNPKLKLLLKNYTLSDDIAFRFSSQAWSEWPLTTDKYLRWLKKTNKKEEVINLFMDYETFGEHQWADSGVFDFMRVLPEKIIEDGEFTFNTPFELGKKLKPIADLHVPYPISWADEERDLSAWLGNEMQDEAFDKLYSLTDAMKNCNDPQLNLDWLKLQASDHFYYMCTKWFSDGDVHDYFNPYPSPYEAFINYMNVLSDFMIRLDEYQKSNSDKPIVDITFNFDEFNDMTVARLKEALKELSAKEIAFIRNNTNTEIASKIEKYLGKRKQKAIDELKTIESYTKGQFNTLKNKIAKFL